MTILALAVATWLPVPVHALPLAALEAQAMEHGLVRRLAHAEREQRLHQLEAAQALDGARLQADIGLSHAQEAVTDTTSRRYERGHARLGIRWPLLGGRQIVQRARDEAEIGLEAADLRERDAREAVRSEVRRAYVALAAAQSRAAFAQAWLEQRKALQTEIDRRDEARLLLKADRLAYATQVDTVARDLARQHMLARHAWRTLAALAGLASDAAPPAAPWPDWPSRCLERERIAADVSLPVALARLDAQAARQEMDRLRWEGIEAYLSLTQGFSRDFGGPSGHGTAIALDMGMPLQWGRWRDARRAQVYSRLDQALVLAALREQERQLAIEQALDEAALRAQERDTYARRLEAALQGWRVAVLRAASLLDAEGIERAAQAQFALYQSIVEYLDARERATMAHAQALSFAGECIAQAAQSDELELRAMTALRSAVDWGAQSPLPMGWYVWQGQALLDDPSRLERLPSITGRLALSFTADELDRFERDAAERQRLVDLLKRLRARGWRVEWLLGEPRWVLRQHRDDLLKRLASLRTLPFDAVHLDLERSQLPSYLQRHWARDVVETLAAVRRVVHRPIVLTTHYRELTEARLGKRLREAGVDEVVAMVYVTQPDRAIALGRAALDAAPEGLTVTLAWSIEPDLDQANSHFKQGRAAALSQWQAWHQALASHPRYGGWFVQSLETYLQAAP